MTTASASPEIALEEPANLGVRSRRPGMLRRMRWFGIAIFIWILAQVGGSALVQYTRLRSILNARLEAAFGRRIEVGRYSLSLVGMA